MKNIFSLCLFIALYSTTQAQTISASDMLKTLSYSDTTSINQLLKKNGYSGFMMEVDTIPNLKLWGGFNNLRNPCLTSDTKDTDLSDEITYQVSVGHKCEYVKFATMCLEPYQSIVNSFKMAGFDIGNALLPIIPKGKGSSDHTQPDDFNHTSTKNDYTLTIFVNHQPLGLFYNVMLEPTQK